MIGLMEIRCSKNRERVVWGSRRIKQDFADIAEMLKYGTFPVDTMQYNYDTLLQDGIELNVIAICNRHELAETEETYLVEWKDDPSLVNERDAQGLPIGVTHLDPVTLVKEWKQRIIDGKKRYSPILKTLNTQIRKICKEQKEVNHHE